MPGSVFKDGMRLTDKAMLAVDIVFGLLALWFLQCFKGIEAPGVHILDAVFRLKISERFCEPLPGIGQPRRGGQSRPCADHHSVSFFNELLQLLCLGREVFDISACLYL